MYRSIVSASRTHPGMIVPSERKGRVSATRRRKPDLPTSSASGSRPEAMMAEFKGFHRHYARPVRANRRWAKAVAHTTQGRRWDGASEPLPTLLQTETAVMSGTFPKSSSESPCRLVPGIHVFPAIKQERRGWPGRQPAMTERGNCEPSGMLCTDHLHVPPILPPRAPEGANASDKKYSKHLSGGFS